MGAIASRDSNASPYFTLDSFDSASFDPVEYVAKCIRKANIRSEGEEFQTYNGKAGASPKFLKRRRIKKRTKRGGRLPDLDSNASHSPTGIEKENVHSKVATRPESIQYKNKTMEQVVKRRWRRGKKNNNKNDRNSEGLESNEDNHHSISNLNSTPHRLLSIRRRCRKTPKTYGLIATEEYHFSPTNKIFESASQSSASPTCHSSLSGSEASNSNDGVFKIGQIV
jgi:hypothetical protein